MSGPSGFSPPFGAGRRDEPPSVTIGANLFHQWAASRLAPNMHEVHGRRFVFEVNRQLAPIYPFATEIDAMLVKAKIVGWRPRFETQREYETEIDAMLTKSGIVERRPDPPSELACPECPCGTDAKRADCLSGRFYKAFKSITAESIARWYTLLPERKARHVLEFIKAETQSDPLFRKALEAILTQLAGRPVTVERGRGRPSKSLRDAFMFTAMSAVHEWLGIPLVGKDRPKDCAAHVAGRFGEEAKTVRERWAKRHRRASENIKIQRPPLP